MDQRRQRDGKRHEGVDPKKQATPSRIRSDYSQLEKENSKLAMKIMHLRAQLTHAGEKVRKLEEALAHYKAGDKEEGQKAHAQYQRMKPRVEKRLAEKVRQHPVFRRNSLEAVLLYLERKDLGADVLPNYGETEALLCEKLGLRSPVVLVSPDMNHMAHALYMTRRQVRRYFAALVGCEALVRIRQEHEASYFIIGEWWAYYDKDKQLKWRRRYIWRDTKKRPVFLKALDSFRL